MRLWPKLLVAGLLLWGAHARGDTTISYGTATLSSPATTRHWDDIWDLTRSDVVVHYVLDARGVTQTVAFGTPWAEVGLREVDAGDFSPGPAMTYQGGKGGWMSSGVGDLAPSPGVYSLMDKHNLGASGGRDERDYDVLDGGIVSPLNTNSSYGIWFDRDTVDSSTAASWGQKDGGTYNTGGVYVFNIRYHAVDAGLGTMHADINGIATGFNVSGGVPASFPAGLSFKGDMRRMQLFAGLVATANGGGTVLLTNLEVTQLDPQPDGGNPDGGSTDGGSTDGGNPDGGSTDGGNPDGGSTDGGSTDGGNPDGGTTDGGTTGGGGRARWELLVGCSAAGSDGPASIFLLLLAMARRLGRR